MSAFAYRERKYSFVNCEPLIGPRRPTVVIQWKAAALGPVQREVGQVLSACDNNSD